MKVLLTEKVGKFGSLVWLGFFGQRKMHHLSGFLTMLVIITTSAYVKLILMADLYIHIYIYKLTLPSVQPSAVDTMMISIL